MTSALARAVQVVCGGPAPPGAQASGQARWLSRFPLGLQVLGFISVLAVVVIGSSYRAYVDSAQALIRESESEHLIGAALVAPKPAFSTTTASAMRGCSTGAKAM